MLTQLGSCLGFHPHQLSRLQKSSTLLTLRLETNQFMSSKDSNSLATEINLQRKTTYEGQVKLKRPLSLTLAFLTCTPIDSNKKNVCDRLNDWPQF